MNRRILTVILFLLLGAIVNVAVAWGCATWVNAMQHGHGTQGWFEDSAFQGEAHWLFERQDAFGATRINLQTHSDTLRPATGMVTLVSASCDRRDAMRQSLAEAYSPVVLIDDSRGWPFRALMCHWDFGLPAIALAPKPRALHFGIEMKTFGGDVNRGGLDFLRALPLRPIWPGFAINTVFYAAILWLLFAAPFALRRRSRIKHGLCPQCAYPVGARDVCTECGHAREGMMRRR